MKGNEWLAEASTEKSQAFEEYSRLTQADARKFDTSSMQMLRLPGGAMALVGKLQEGEDSSGLLTVSQEVAKDGLLETPLDAPVATITEEVPPLNYEVSFRELLWREMDGMNSVIFGTLEQAAADPAKRKSAILNAIDAFRSFMAMGLDQIGSTAVKLDRELVLKPKQEEDEMFKSKEEFAAAVGEVVAPILQEFGVKLSETLKTELAPPPAEPATKTEPATSPETQTPGLAEMISKAVTDAMAPLKEKVETVAAKQEEIDNQLVTPPATTTEPTVTTTKSDKPKSIFTGLLTGEALTRQEVRQQF